MQRGKRGYGRAADVVLGVDAGARMYRRRMGVSFRNSSMVDMGSATREDGHSDRIEPERERWGGMGLHRGGAAGGRGRAEATREDAAREAGEEEDDGEVAGHGDPWVRLVVRMGSGQCSRARR